MKRGIGISEKKAARLLTERIRMTLDYFSNSYQSTDCDLDKVKVLAIKQILNEVKEKKP